MWWLRPGDNSKPVFGHEDTVPTARPKGLGVILDEPYAMTGVETTGVETGLKVEAVADSFV